MPRFFHINIKCAGASPLRRILCLYGCMKVSVNIKESEPVRLLLLHLHKRNYIWFLLFNIFTCIVAFYPLFVKQLFNMFFIFYNRFSKFCTFFRSFIVYFRIYELLFVFIIHFIIVVQQQ